METKENFNQVIHKLFPVKENRKDSITKAIVHSLNLAEEPYCEPSASDPHKPLGFQSVYDNNFQQHIETTHITRDTSITGSISAKSNLEISGNVFGDLESQKSIKVSGRIEGNISGKMIEINNGSVKGNITASERLTIINKSEITGNLSANELELNSKVNGNINVKRNINIQKDSTVIGDINATTITIENGAIIKSMMGITGEKSEESVENPDKESLL